MTQKRFLSPFSRCAVSCLTRNWYMPDCKHILIMENISSNVHRTLSLWYSLNLRFELSLDQEIEVQNHFLRSKVFWLWVNGRIRRVCTLEFRIFQVNSLTIVLKSLSYPKIPNSITDHNFNFNEQDRTPLLRELSYSFGSSPILSIVMVFVTSGAEKI